VLANDDSAIYFSRAIVPYVRNYPWQQWLDNQQFFTHIGLYAYRADVLSKITKLPQSSLELAESLEQLRWVQNGYKIKVGRSTCPTIGIDTPADLEEARKFCEQLNK
jgi:3-deoxy-manno-octulosonate cytidylyltransferase (CMP-KDO synthetase)